MTLHTQATPLPDDISVAIRTFKQQLREQIGDVEALFARVSQRIESAIAEAKEEEQRYGTAWPIVTQESIAQGEVSNETLARIKRRGCVVVKQQFPREQALAWDQSLLDYLDLNDFDAQYRGPGDNFFGRQSLVTDR